MGTNLGVGYTGLDFLAGFVALRFKSYFFFRGFFVEEVIGSFDNAYGAMLYWVGLYRFDVGLSVFSRFA